MQLFFKVGKRGDLLAYASMQGRRVIALYDRDEPEPKAGTVDVIVTGISRDGRRVFVVRKDGLVAVDHDGFACFGSMCQTLAFSRQWQKTVSPGRAPVHVADQISGRNEPRRPGTVYCRPRLDFRPLKPIRAYALDFDDVGLPPPSATAADDAQTRPQG